MSQKDIGSYQQLLDYLSKYNGVGILNFHKPCTPCKLIAPHIETFRREYPVPIVNINVDKVQELATRFDVRAIPTFILVKKTAGDIEIIDCVFSANHVRLEKLFESGVELRGGNRK